MASEDYKFVQSTGGGYTGYGGPRGDYVVPGDLLGLFDDIEPEEAAAGQVDYRCLYVQYEGNTLATGCRVWFDNNLDIGALAAGVDLINTDAEYIGPPGTGAPTGLSFTDINAYSSHLTGLPIGTGVNTSMVSGDYRAVWLRRTIPTGSPVDPSESYSIYFGGVSTS